MLEQARTCTAPWWLLGWAPGEASTTPDSASPGGMQKEETEGDRAAGRESGLQVAGCGLRVAGRPEERYGYLACALLRFGRGREKVKDGIVGCWNGEFAQLRRFGGKDPTPNCYFAAAAAACCFLRRASDLV